MPSKKKRMYSPEFKLGAVRLAETSDESMAQIERNLGNTVGCLRKWTRRLETNARMPFQIVAICHPPRSDCG